MTSSDPMRPHNDPIMAEKILEYWFCEKIEKKIFFRKSQNFQSATNFFPVRART